MLNKENFNFRYLAFALISITLFVLMIVNESIYDQFHTDDFKVFYLAAKALISDQTVYGVPFGLDTGFYKYSPATLLLFTSYTLVSYKIASIIHFSIIGISAILAIILLEQVIDKHLFKIEKKGLLSLILILLGILIHLIRDLHLGNTNMILVLFLIIGLKLSLESHEKYAGIFLALVILTKPYFIILMLPFLVSKKYKTIVSTAITGFGLTLLTGFILGFHRSLILHIEWFQEMLRHSSYLISPYTIFYYSDFYLGIAIPSKFHFLLFGLIVILISLYFWFYNNRKSQNRETNKVLIFNYFILIAIIPSLLITDVEHFIFSLPLIAIIIYYLKKENNYYWIIGFILIILMFGGNSSDLVGNELSYKIKIWGWVGIGNLFILLSSFLVFNKMNKEEKEIAAIS